MELTAIILLIINGLFVCYLGLLIILLSKGQKHIKTVVDAGVRLSVPILRYVYNHPHFNWIIPQLLTFNRIMREFIEENIKEK